MSNDTSTIINLDCAGNYPKNEQIAALYPMLCRYSFNLHSKHKLGDLARKIYLYAINIIKAIFTKYKFFDFIASSGSSANKFAILNN